MNAITPLQRQAAAAELVTLNCRPLRLRGWASLAVRRAVREAVAAGESANRAVGIGRDLAAHLVRLPGARIGAEVAQ